MRKRILLFGGTTEGRILASGLLESGYEITVSVASELGASELEAAMEDKRNALKGHDRYGKSPGGFRQFEILVGKKDEREIESLLCEYDLVIDATHPYALLASSNIKGACKATDTEYIRVARGTGDTAICDGDRVILAADHTEAADILKDKKGNILIATGSKNLLEYSSLEAERLYVRVLPTHEALNACEECGISSSHIIAMQGPFPEELNVALMRQLDIDIMVTKESGKEGGFEEKLSACRKTGTWLVVIARPCDEGISVEEVLERL